MPKVDLSRRFGRVIRRRREAAGLSQEELAFRAGVTRNYVSLVERGHRNPSLNVIGMLALGLQTTIASLIRSLDETR